MRELVVEADGGSRGNPGPAGYGAVVLDPATGEILAEAAEYIGVATNNVAEYKGLIAGLRAALDVAPDATVRVRMDSKLVVEQMSGRWKIKHPDMKPLAAEASRAFPRDRVTYEWIPRERNKHADRLANEAMDAGKRGEQWTPRDTSAAQVAATLPPAGPPGDATAGAARARAALSAAVKAPGAAATDATAPARAAGADAVTAVGTRSAGRGGTPSGGGWAQPPVPGAGSQDPSAAEPAPAVPAPVGPVPDMAAPATFVLLRHGETALTPEKRFSGSGGADPELSEAGRRQAAAVADALAARGTIQHIVSSPLTRCRQTAEAVATRLGLDVVIEQGLRETDFGVWEGLTFAEVRARYPEDMDAWLASPTAAPTGGGESFASVTRRVAAARDRLAAAHAGRTVLVVSHVTPIKTLVRLALGAPPPSLFKFELSAASLSAVAYYADGNASVRLLNDTSHLRR
ncbi:bifunctional RNase H/acid phosphatase [Streptomyces sp. R302]|uniref:bifunctional RNase H/acid phosphatase n=1 Tax=unclassified Streptomyces TaxID=2593676 RepID=UPI00145CB898|nr:MULTISPECIES: bifunctional RNase H/acid phosphatase [unclassified Streptomyces]NML49420.1 bifunctional RNase H/acid phosphatase [Streptomyces sp. R301]NML77747.1 bifunctional RNase H/acid phosphatase [Streptomyces sp. R302]